MGSCLNYPSCLRKDVSLEDAHIIQLQNLTFDEVDETTYTFKKAKVLKVYDGDTFWIAAWCDNRIQKFRVRLYGVDCSEMKGGTVETKLHAQKAKEYLEHKILNQIIDINVLNNKLYKDPKAKKEKRIREKYGRLLCIIHMDGINIADEIIKLGLGVAYYGGTKKEPLETTIENTSNNTLENTSNNTLEDILED
jgi:endonuclease YncB( thermonuclease family)